MKRTNAAWEDNFAPNILKRGVDYYERGLVRELKQIDGIVTAIVSGSEEYVVELDLIDGEVAAMFCTCPYAKGGECCKHMAAVCMAKSAGNNVAPAREQPVSEQVDHFLQMVEDMTETQLREVLLTLASDDEDIKNKIMMQASGSLPKGRMRSLEADVDALADRAEDEDGFIDYRNAWDYISSLEGLLGRETELLLRSGLVMEAFELTCYAFLEAGTAEMDDSDGGLTSLGEYCSSLWRAQVNAAEPKQREAMFAWFEATVDENPGTWFEDVLLDAQMSLFRDAALIERSIVKADERLAAAEKNMREHLYGSYELSHAVMDRLLLMEISHRPPEELASFRAKYHHLPEVRKAEIEEHIRARRFDEAIALLRESKTMDSEYPTLVAQYSKGLIELFEKTGQTKELTDELRYQVFECWQDDLVFVDRLKTLTPQARWIDLREDVLKAKTMQYIRLDFLESEELWSRLLDELSALGSLDDTDRFEKTLKNRYPQEIKAIYLSCLRKRMWEASNRKAYRELIRYLAKIAKYPDGWQDTRELADEWRSSFPRRSSMLDELEKAGF